MVANHTRQRFERLLEPCQVGRLKGIQVVLDALLNLPLKPVELNVLAAWSGLTASLSVAIAGVMCWTLGWDQGAATLGLAASSSALFAGVDDPRPSQKVMLGAAVLGAVPMAAAYAARQSG
jgi:hypothetical protein